VTDKTDHSEKRGALRQKISDSEDALVQTVPARDPPEGLRALAMEYPFAVLAGGVAIGLIAGAFIPRAAGRKAGRSLAAAATVVGELAALYGTKALEATSHAADESRSRLSDFGDTASHALGSFSGKAAGTLHEGGRAAASAARDGAETARDASLRLARKARKIASNLRH